MRFVAIGATDPPPHAPQVNTMAIIRPAASNATRNRIAVRLRAFRRARGQFARPASMASAMRNIRLIGLPAGGQDLHLAGANSDRAVVETFTVTSDTPDPVRVTDCGVNEHVAHAGAPWHVNVTVPCNPCCGSTASA